MDAINRLRAAEHLASIVRTAALGATVDWATSLLLPRGFFEREVIESVDVVFNTVRPTELGELVRLDRHWNDGVTAGSELLRSLVDLVMPEIEGVGKVVAHETPKGGVVVLRDLGNIHRRHGGISECIKGTA